MITATLAGLTGTAHKLVVEPLNRIEVTHPRGNVGREIAVRVRAAFAGRSGQTGRVNLPEASRCEADLAVAFALDPPHPSRGFDAALGELSLSGEVRPVRGIIPVLEALRDSGVKRCVVPASQREAACVPGIEVYGLRVLGEMPELMPAWAWRAHDWPLSLDEVLGLEDEKAQLREAIAAGRDVLFVGDPGTGKAMLARRVPTLLPPMTDEERLDCARIWSAAGLDVRPEAPRPFRAPHHTVSAAGLCGGGTPLRVGEVTLAHHGVLFLDELGEFSRQAIRDLGAALAAGSWRGMPSKPRVVAACNEYDLPRLGPFADRFVRITLPRLVR